MVDYCPYEPNGSALNFKIWKQWLIKWEVAIVLVLHIQPMKENSYKLSYIEKDKHTNFITTCFSSHGCQKCILMASLTPKPKVYCIYFRSTWWSVCLLFNFSKKPKKKVAKNVQHHSIHNIYFIWIFCT